MKKPRMSVTVVRIGCLRDSVIAIPPAMFPGRPRAVRRLEGPRRGVLRRERSKI